MRPEPAYRKRGPSTSRRGAAAVWERAQDTFLSQVVGPHFERLCREWVSWHADPETFGGLPIDISAGSVPAPAARTSHEVDVVVHGAVGQDQGILLSIGEAKWNKVIDVRHLDRLRHIVTLLTAAASTPPTPAPPATAASASPRTCTRRPVAK
jgi:hypothetical protein